MSSTRHIATVVAAVALLLLAGCAAKPAAPDAPASAPAPASGSTANAEPGKSEGAPQSPEAIDDAVYQVLAGYMDALYLADYAAAAGYWSPASSVTPPSGETLKTPGVSDWLLQTVEVIQSTETTAYVQIAFTVTVQGGDSSYRSGLNIRFVQLAKQNGAWKILSIATNALM